jgi:hypothetical protein
VPPVLGTALLLGTAQSRVNRHLLAMPAMRAVGLVSYSLYLWHWPLISIARLVFAREPSLWVRMILLVLSGALAAASYRYVESPFRRTGTPARVSLLRYAGALGVWIALIGSALLADGYPQRWPRQFMAQVRQFEAHRSPCLAMHHDATPETSELCFPSEGREVAVVGDSHAAALAPGLRAMAARHGLGLVVEAKASCQFLVGISRKVVMHPELLGDCAAFDQRVMELLLDNPRISAVIIAGAWRAGSMKPTHYVALDGRQQPADELLVHGLARAVRTLQRSGKRVAIVRDVPVLKLEPRSHLATCANRLRSLLNGLDTGADCRRVAPEDTVSDAPARAILARVARDTGVPLVDLRPEFCDRSGCRIADDGHTFYLDPQHLSRAGSSQASTAFEPWIEAVAETDRVAIDRGDPLPPTSR